MTDKKSDHQSSAAMPHGSTLVTASQARARGWTPSRCSTQRCPGTTWNTRFFDRV
jgi:hypothetical protein